MPSERIVLTHHCHNHIYMCTRTTSLLIHVMSPQILAHKWTLWSFGQWYLCHNHTYRRTHTNVYCPCDQGYHISADSWNKSPNPRLQMKPVTAKMIACHTCIRAHTNMYCLCDSRYHISADSCNKSPNPRLNSKPYIQTHTHTCILSVRPRVPNLC